MHCLSHAPHEFYLVTRPGHPPGHAGRVGALPWRDNVHEVPESEVADGEFDCVLFQSYRHFVEDAPRVLSAAQRRLPTLYVEHDPPQQHPTGTLHPAGQRGIHLIHVTPFNALMWDNGEAEVTVIEHGVPLPEAPLYSGARAKGIVVVNNLRSRGRRLGCDLFEQMRRELPLQLVGMDSESLGGAGEIANDQLSAYIAQFRFFFNPIRYTSLGLAMLEAMAAGMPIVAFATTEVPMVIRDGVNGYADTRPRQLEQAMRTLLDEPALARRLGEAARQTVSQRFSLQRFARDWDGVLRTAASCTNNGRQS
ncbi:MAG: glycosyltransferase family 4 protein [Burkholderiaceae bacterium]